MGTEELFKVWYMIGAALVFFMQCGFAMVESGFTRAKNAGNIIMKNLMDFCIGAVVFVAFGFPVMMSENYIMGLIGVPDLRVFTSFYDFPWEVFVFNLVFCATAATIVSGAMAERTKFSSYCIYSAVISALIYPIEAGWVWNSQGWLVLLGFHDYAGSTAIHFVGGLCALIGAIMVGPRLGKYVKDASGKITSRAIQGHNIPMGALGVFILWFGWYGFNGAAATDWPTLAQIFLTTTLAPAFATVVAMMYTWIKNGKPDVSMTLNASLAGLVAITAPCDCVNALGSIIIGIVSGFLVCIVVEVLDLKLHVDDPVGAVGVHFANGIWGTIAVGLFSTGADGVLKGLFYGGGFYLLGIQLLGLLVIGLFVGCIITLTFTIIKKTNGLRVTDEEQIMGLDRPEHGLLSAYADFMPAFEDTGFVGGTNTYSVGDIPEAAAVPVVRADRSRADGVKISKVEIITRQERLEVLKSAMMDLGITGMTVTHVLGCGAQKGKPEFYRGAVIEANLLPKVQVEMVVCKVPVEAVIETAKAVLYTGHIGDGKIFVYDVEEVVKVRTSETGYDALQDEE